MSIGGSQHGWGRQRLRAGKTTKKNGTGVFFFPLRAVAAGHSAGGERVEVKKGKESEAEGIVAGKRGSFATHATPGCRPRGKQEPL